MRNRERGSERYRETERQGEREREGERERLLYVRKELNVLVTYKFLGIGKSFYRHY